VVGVAHFPTNQREKWKRPIQLFTSCPCRITRSRMSQRGRGTRIGLRPASICSMNRAQESNGTDAGHLRHLLLLDRSTRGLSNEMTKVIEKTELPKSRIRPGQEIMRASSTKGMDSGVMNDTACRRSSDRTWVTSLARTPDLRTVALAVGTELCMRRESVQIRSRPYGLPRSNSKELVHACDRLGGYASSWTSRSCRPGARERER
jgi:hypothetical protein